MPSALVLLDEELPVHPRELAPELARVLGRVPYDVLSAFNRCSVLPFEDLDDGQARAAVELLEGRGVRATAVPAERLPPAPKVFLVHNADVEAEELAVQIDMVGNMRKLPWGEIATLSAASISQSTGMTGLRGPSTARELGRAAGRMAGYAIGMPMGMGSMHRSRRKRPRMKPRTESYTLIALAPREAPIEIRFRSDQLNYDYLGERLGLSLEHNFRTFAADLVGGASGARVSPGLAALIEKGTPPPAMLAPDALGRYNRWLKLMAGEGL